ncbi:MAG: hypothetical protein AB2693_31215 [Candidatus Thiodiazotropha sp.]
MKQALATTKFFFIRLQKAMVSSTKSDLLNQAKSEFKLLQTYDVKVPVQDKILHSKTQVDQNSVQILNMFHPVMNTDVYPLQTVGDGNCLYRAASLALTGSQEYHTLLRLKTAIEVIQNRQSYDTKKKHNDFLNGTRIVTSDYQKLVKDVVTKNTYAEMAHMYALSASLGFGIHSYYPPQLNSELSSAFTRDVYGRKIEPGSNCKLSVMWTSAIVPRIPKDFRVNHFVPLVPKQSSVSITAVEPTNNAVSETLIAEKSPDEQFGDISDIGVSGDLHCSFKAENFDMDTVPWDRSNSEEMLASSPCPNVDIENANQTETSDKYACISAKSGQPTETESFQGTLDNKFLDAGTICSLLIKSKVGSPTIPGGLKENVYFILNNANNLKKKKSNKSSAFSDDCGV